MTAQQRVVGTSVTRIDALEKVTGRARYAPELRFSGMLHAKTLRSPHPHALVVSIDASRAEKLRGVRAAPTIMAQRLCPRHRHVVSPASWAFACWPS